MITPATPQSIEAAAQLLRSGKLVAFPTETVYGLGGDARNDHAIAAIYLAKGRPQFNPLIIHVDAIEKLTSLVVWNDKARLVAQTFWPGPITLVLPRTPDCPVSLLASAGLETLAVRIPSHPIAKELLRSANIPIAAPSANASGRLSPTCPEDVYESLGNKVDCILSGGKSEVGVESTVLDLTTDRPTILRPGGITKEQLQDLIGPVFLATHDETAPKSPGMLLSHYAPDCHVRLNIHCAASDEAFLIFGDESLYQGGAKRLNLSPTGDLKEAAANLFSMLRQLDTPEHKAIAIAPIPMTGLGLAINDRLARAAAPRP